ncbi:protein containing PDZ/DHR/GLGF domain [Sulfurimonas gotlandica GD1]|uniref:Protein containing PDZ/DHR/GLGF domain n=1 Tax=Sulfurimonas gotlandica (strain DSM 19862 / JCM 16533 / GD1) TaxID=929558 RepID=B6BLX6_SULGG|nr:PDZ domain-containing protein [Sulfurimonas gotlandica]EDZ61904.1 pdz/dhr/glgf [Sulfurimonas gotlandica GD1]EHP29450.1 protein containing PDZ/DHR/GLGF domain [Sulfurimonas gotlandica GD1]
MFRLFLALNFLLLNLFACKGGYESCKLKITDSKSIKYQTLQIPVLKNKRLLFSSHLPNAKIIKYDPFLSLYLVEDRTKFEHPFKINNHLSLGVASVNNKRAIEGKIVKDQIGLNNFATFNEPLATPALLLNSCCALEGIVTPQGIIQKEYLERFLKSKSAQYGDIGIRVDDIKKSITITRVNPFIKDNPFQEGDTIVDFAGKKVKDSATLMRKILFSKVGSTHSVKIKRDSKYFTFKVKTQKRYGGGYISDTFLEQKGIYFSKNLTILKIANEFEGYGLKVGDRLMQVNGVKVSIIADIREHISDFKYFASLLFEREHFQFFVNIKGKVKSNK